MSNIAHDYVEDYIRSLIHNKNSKISDLEVYARDNNVPIVHPEVAQFIRVMIKTKGIKKILEVGTAIGYSSIIMAEAAGEDCSIISIEKSDEMYNEAQKNIKEFGFDSRIKVIKGDALDILDGIDDEFDMIFLDAAKGHYDHFLPKCIGNLKINGLIISDNVLFRGMVATNQLLIRRKITIVKRMRKYLQHITEMDELETSILPLGDGLAVSCKVKEVL